MKTLTTLLLLSGLAFGTLQSAATITDSLTPPTENVVFFNDVADSGINVRWRAGGTDQDNGSTFKMGSETLLLDAITMRIHPNNFGVNVPGSPLILDFFGFDGTSAFTPLWRVTANLPLTTEPNDYIRWELSGQGQTLAAGQHYGFLIGAAVEDPNSGPRIFRIWDNQSNVKADAVELRRDYEFGSIRPANTVLPNIRADRDLLFYVQAIPEPSALTLAVVGFTLLAISRRRMAH